MNNDFSVVRNFRTMSFKITLRMLSLHPHRFQLVLILPHLTASHPPFPAAFGPQAPAANTETIALLNPLPPLYNIKSL